MNQRHQDLATRVTSAFREGLDAAGERSVGEAHFEELHRLVCEALGEELQSVTGRLEALVQALRAEMEKPELGL